VLLEVSTFRSRRSKIPLVQDLCALDSALEPTPVAESISIDTLNALPIE
jgi:hypothetical protein